MQKARQEIEAELSLRRPMSDETYLAEIGLPPEKADICLAVRQAYAEAAKVEPEKLYPTDRGGWLGYRLPLPLDDLKILFDLEKRLAVTIPSPVVREIWLGPRASPAHYRFPGLTVAQFTTDLVKAIEGGRCPAITG
jgi:hypothetical protein